LRPARHPDAGVLASRTIRHQHPAGMPARAVLAIGILPSQHEAFTELQLRIRDIARARPCFGYRPIHVSNTGLDLTRRSHKCIGGACPSPSNWEIRRPEKSRLYFASARAKSCGDV
jgi:hypothetical protein